MTGEIVDIDPAGRYVTTKWGGRYQFRKVVVRMPGGNDKKSIPITFNGATVAQLQNLGVGDLVNVWFDIEGNSWEDRQKTKHYSISATGRRIEAVAGVQQLSLFAGNFKFEYNPNL